MMKYLFLIIITAAIVACNKTTTLPSYTPPVSNIFAVTSLNHTLDTVSVGDTVYLNASGLIYDTLAVYAYFSVSSSSTGSPIYSVGSSASPIKLATALATKNPTDTNRWSAVIALPKVTGIASSKLTITGNFSYQLNLSTMGYKPVTVSDAGQKTKTVYVQ